MVAIGEDHPTHPEVIGSGRPMVTVQGDFVGRMVDLGAVAITPDLIVRYAEAIDDAEIATNPTLRLPLGIVLALRGFPRPSVAAAPGTVSVYGGHAIALHGELAVGRTYGVHSQVAGVFEKSGRSGPLTVVARRAEVCADDGRLMATLDEQEIVRWTRPVRDGSGEERAVGGRTTAPTLADSAPVDLAALDVGDLFVEPWSAPDARIVAAYGDLVDSTELLFTNVDFARRMGYRSVIVPGPLQSAAVERMLRRRVSHAALVRLHMTFRMSISPTDATIITATVVERRPLASAAAVICDLALENAAAELVATGTAELHPI